MDILKAEIAKKRKLLEEKNIIVSKTENITCYKCKLRRIVINTAVEPI